jgi:hypothetical protein
VLGDYKIESLEEKIEESTNPKEITIDGATYVLKENK